VAFFLFCSSVEAMAGFSMQDLFKELGIYGLPTFLFVCKGMIIEKIVGNFPRELDNKLRYYDHIASCLGT
jgi:thioredoxin-related protein